jgi:rubrerythrin
MAETVRNSDEQEPPTATQDEGTPQSKPATAATTGPADPGIAAGEAASGGDATMDPFAAGKGRIDEVDQSKGIFPADAPHPASDTARAPGALGGGPYDESGRGGVAVSLDQSTSGAAPAGAEVARDGGAGIDPSAADAGAAAVDASAADAGPTGTIAADADLTGIAARATGASGVGAEEASANEANADVTGRAAVAAGGADPRDAGAISTLHDLIHLDSDAIQAYRHAVDACETAEIRARLSEFMADHERHVRDLRAAVRSLGSEPPEGRDLKGFFIEGFTAIASQGDRSALFAMRGNEELTNRRYDDARSAGLPGNVQLLIERNYEDEARHLAWIKEAISSHAWDTDAGGKRAA